MHIGILQAETLPANVNEQFGSYGEMFVRLLTPLNSSFSFRIYQVDRGQLPNSAKECDAYVVTGSRFSAYDNEDWIAALIKFIRDINDTKQKCLGICFGHQVIAEALGGKVERAKQGWGLGVGSFNIKEDAWLLSRSTSKTDFRILLTHQDQVTRLPPDAELLASNDACPIGAYSIGHHILCFQGHPEFKPDYLRFLINKRKHLIDEARVAKALNSLNLDLDQSLLNTWIGRFLSS